VCFLWRLFLEPRTYRRRSITIIVIAGGSIITASAGLVSKISGSEKFEVAEGPANAGFFAVGEA